MKKHLSKKSMLCLLMGLVCHVAWAQTPFLTLTNLSQESYPHALTEEQAEAVFAEENLTIAFEVTTATSISGRGAIICAADPTATVPSTGVKENSTYVAYGHYNTWGAYFPSSKDGDRFSLDGNNGNLDANSNFFAASTDYQVVYIIDKTNQKNSLYVNGIKWAETSYPKANGYTLQSFNNFKVASGHKLYIGGGVTSTNDKYDLFDGTIHSVQFFNTVLTDEEIAAIKYSPEEESDTYIVDMTTGTFAGSGNYRSSWTYTTTEDNPAALTLSCGGINNMNSHEGLIQLHSGSAKSSTYTIAVPAGYTIVSYSFDYTFGNSGTGDKKFVVGDQEYPVTADKQTLTVEDVNAETTTFVLSENNEPVKVSNFVVKVKAPTTSELIEAKTTAKTEAEANGDQLGEALGYYSYTANGGKLYSVDAVKDAIDAATTIAEITAIVESFALNVPEVGKYYRIKGISGNYIDAVNCYSGDQMGMKSGEACNYLGTIFLLDEGNRLKNVATDTYVHGTRHIGATKANANTWTFAASTRTLGCLTLTSNHSDSKELHDNSGNRADRCSSICGNRHDFTIEEVKAVTLTVDAPTRVNASATWNGETKTLPATWIILEGTTVDEPTLSVSCCDSYTFDGLFENEESLGNTVTIASLGANRAITAQFSPAFFSESYGGKWTNIVRATNAAHAAILGSAESGTIPTFNTIDYANEGILWCFVGNAESFKIYNKVSGDALALTWNDNTPADGEVVKMTTASEAISWHLIEYDNGYAIAPVGNNAFGINSYTGQAGSQLKFYGVGDNGTHWNFNLMDITKPLTLDVEVDQVWESSPRVAELTLSINGTNSQTRILGNVEGKKMYLPTGSTFSLSSMTYRGYTFNGFGGEDSYENATLPEGGLEITASYTANDERTLFYSPRDGHPYRIPAIATAPNGDIFAICDYRPCGNDIGYGEVDLVCRVSSDNGVTWTEERTIADGLGHINDGIWKMGFGDPAIVADRESNKVLVMSVCGNRTCWDGNYGEGGENENPNRISRLYIEHDGEKWVYGQPEEVTYDIYPLFKNEGGEAYAASMFIGAGKICQSRVVKKGEYYRLYCSVWAVTKSIRTHHNYVIYSDDFGKTWNVLGGVGNDANPSQPGPAFGGNEPKCEELPDGTVVLSSRKSGGRYFNLFTFDDDNDYTTGSWGTVVSSNDITDGLSFGGNSTNGEIYKVKAIHKESGRICDLMFQSIPTGNDRSNVAVYYKEMEYTEAYTPTTFAQGWTQGKQVSQKASCYSTMILQADGRIGFFFEEVPGGYCMVYIPYTLEDLTAGQYSLYTVTSSITDAEIGTFYASEAMTIPEGVKAYVATEHPTMDGDAGTITMTELEGIIPAHTGAVLRGATNSYKFIPSISYGTSIEDNMLVGYEAENTDANSRKAVTVAADYTTYVLAVENSIAGFYRKPVGTFNVYNNKAYLDLTDAAQGVRSLTIRFGADEETTAIEPSTLNAQPSTIIYDLQGRRVENPARGVYIVNGKKVVIR